MGGGKFRRVVTSVAKFVDTLNPVIEHIIVGRSGKEIFGYFKRFLGEFKEGFQG